MGNQQTNEIYKQYFNPQPTPLMNINYQPCYHQLRLATQEEPIEEEESRDDEDAMYRDQMFLQQMKGSFHENIMIDADDMHGQKMSKQQYMQQQASPNNLHQHQHLRNLSPTATNFHHQCKKKITVKLEDGLPDLQICIEDQSLTCGWLINEVTRRYAQLIDSHKSEYQKAVQYLRSTQTNSINDQQNSNNQINLVLPTKIKKKIIAAIKSQDNNESLDFWLTLYNRSLSALQDGTLLDVHFTKIIPNRKEAVCMNDFQLLKVIGRGGFSKVFLVRKKDSGLLFAMKVMEKSFVMGDGKLKQVMSERSIMESLDHPFIVKLHWAFQSREELNFVMDLCAGGELFYLLHQRGKMREVQAKFYFAEILLGLEYIHSKGIVYRDLKPENVLLDIDGHIKLADFGLSKNLQSVNDFTNSFCGSPEYMSPEMLTGQGHGFAIDYYSLGAILFEMLTGLPPFYSTDRNQMYQDIVEAELIYPDYLNPVVIDLLRLLLCKDQTQRYSFDSLHKIKQHAWCRDIQWQAMLDKQIEPLWLPDITKSNFDPDYTNLPVDLKVTETPQDIIKQLNKGRRQAQRSIYCCVDNSAMTSFYDNTTIAENSGFLQNQHSIYYENGNQTNQYLNIYSSRSKLLEMSGNQSLLLKSPQIKELDKALDQMFKGFSFYSEPVEEKEVQRQIKEYLKIKEQMKRKTQQNKIKPSNFEELKQQVRGEIPPRAQRKDQLQQSLKLNSMKSAAQAIQSLTSAQEHQQKLLEVSQQLQIISPIKPQNIMGRVNHDVSATMLEEEISIAQEFSRIDEDEDIDEQPKQIAAKINKVKINHATENSITRANEKTKKIFESYAAQNLSPSQNHTNNQTISKMYNGLTRANTKSSDNTPFNMQRRDYATENNSIVGQQVHNPDNSSKKPKFLQKFTNFLTGKDAHKKNLMQDFSPIQAKQQSQIIFQNQGKTFSSQWCSPNKPKTCDRNTFISDYSGYQGSLVNPQQQNNLSIGQNSFSRNNSGGVAGSLQNSSQIGNQQRNSVASVIEVCQGSVIMTQPSQKEYNHIQSLIIGQPKSRNANQNMNNMSTSLVRSQENTLQGSKPSSTIVKQKTSHQLNFTPFSVIDNIQQNSQSIKGFVQQSFCQKPPRQINQNPPSSGTLSRQQSINYGSQNQVNATTSLTTYQKSKATLSAKTYTNHTSLQRKQSNNQNNDSQISTNFIISTNNMPLSNNSSQISNYPKKNLKLPSSTNVLSQVSGIDRATNQQNITPKQNNAQGSVIRQDSLSQKRKYQQMSIQHQYLSNYSSKIMQNSAPNNNYHPKTLQHTASSTNYQSILELASDQALNNQLQNDPLCLGLNTGYDVQNMPGYKQQSSTVTSQSSVQNKFFKETDVNVVQYQETFSNNQNQRPVNQVISQTQGSQSQASILTTTNSNAYLNTQAATSEMYYKRSSEHHSARRPGNMGSTGNSTTRYGSLKTTSSSKNVRQNGVQVSNFSNNENNIMMMTMPHTTSNSHHNTFSNTRPNSGKNQSKYQRGFMTLK